MSKSQYKTREPKIEEYEPSIVDVAMLKASVLVMDSESDKNLRKRVLPVYAGIYLHRISSSLSDRTGASVREAKTKTLENLAEE